MKATKKAVATETKTVAPAITAKTEAPKAAPVVMVVANAAQTTKPNTFFAAVQALAVKPISLAELITGLAANEKLVPKSKKDHNMVVRVRTNYALNHGYIKAVEAK